MLGQTPLHYASANGYTEIVEALIEKNSESVGIQDMLGQTALHKAAEEGKGNVVGILIKSNPNLVNVRDKEGLTVSDVAAKNGYTDIVKLIEESKLKRVRQAAQSINIELKKQKLLATKISSSTANISHSPKKSQRKTSWSV